MALLIVFVLFEASSVNTLDIRRFADEIVFETDLDKGFLQLQQQGTWSDDSGAKNSEEKPSEIIFEYMPVNEDHGKRMIRLNETLTNFQASNGTLNMIKKSAHNYYNRLVDTFQSSSKISS